MRKTNLDLIRVVAIMAVVFGHTIMLFWDFDPSSPTWAVYNFLWIFIRGFLMLFFMISGTLFFDREQLLFKTHMLRTLHLLLLFYCWSLVFNVFDTFVLHYWTGNGTFLTRVLSGYYHLWFLPTMAMCYCAIPLLHGLVYKNQENIWKGTVLLFSIITILTTLNAIPNKREWLKTALAPYGMQQLRYFVIMPMGWQLYKRKFSERQLCILGISAVTACVFFAWLNRKYSIQIGTATDVYYKDLSVSAGLMGMFVYSFMLGKNTFSARVASLLKTISNCSLGIYLIHPVIIDVLRSRHWNLSQHSALLLFPLCYYCFLLLSFCISWLMLKTPGLKKMIT